MRAAVEDELELVCGRLALRSVRDECVDLVEVYEDDLVRAAMDGEGIRLCSTLVGSCATAVQTAAVTRHTHAIRSEASRAEAPTGTDGHVSRLSGHTFEEAVLGRPGHVLLLLHHSEPAAVVAGVPEPVEAAYAEAWREFHKLASQLGGKVSEIGFATLDLRLNDGPALPTQPLAFQQVLYRAGRGAEPVLIPRRSDPPWAHASSEEIRKPTFEALLAALPASTGRAIHRSVMRLAPLHLDVSEQLQAAADQQECELCKAVVEGVAVRAQRDVRRSTRHGAAHGAAALDQVLDRVCRDVRRRRRTGAAVAAGTPDRDGETVRGEAAGEGAAGEAARHAAGEAAREAAGSACDRFVTALHGACGCATAVARRK